MASNYFQGWYTIETLCVLNDVTNPSVLLLLIQQLSSGDAPGSSWASFGTPHNNIQLCFIGQVGPVALVPVSLCF